MSFILINKPIGPTSHDLVFHARRVFKEKKIGHSGTLDPAACGLLILGKNHGTKFFQYLKDEKTYEFTIRFGIKTDSVDLEGNIVEENDSRPTINAIKMILREFIGNISQIPTKFSAIKINGKRAYDLVRQNIDFEMPEREVTIYELEILNYQDNEAHECETVTLRTTCSAGTYIRTLAQDIAQRVGCISVVIFLKRVAIGSVKLNDVQEGEFVEESLDILKTMYVNLELDKEHIARLQMGQRIRVYDEQIIRFEKNDDRISNQIIRIKLENKLENDFVKSPENEAQIDLDDGVYAGIDSAGKFCGMVKIERAVIFPLCMVKI